MLRNDILSEARPRGGWDGDGGRPPAIDGPARDLNHFSRTDGTGYGVGDGVGYGDGAGYGAGDGDGDGYGYGDGAGYACGRGNAAAQTNGDDQ